jgi:hypothetical protein
MIDRQAINHEASGKFVSCPALSSVSCRASSYN